MSAQNLQIFRLLALRLCLLPQRIGAGAMAAAVLCLAGAAGMLWLVPQLRAQDEAQQRALAQARQSLRAAIAATPVAQPSLAETRLAAFRDTLGEKHYAEQQVKTLFAVAAKNGLALNQAEYKWTFDKNSNTDAYQIRLPVRGSYAAIRRFCEQALLAIPFASLDEISFKREAIGGDMLEAKLRLTLFLDEAPPARTKEAAWE